MMSPISTPILTKSPITVPPANPRVLRAIWKRWKPERPELLIRLRPRPQEASSVSHY